MRRIEGGWLVEETDAAIIMELGGKMGVITPPNTSESEFVPTNAVIMTALAAYFHVHEKKIRDWFVQNKDVLTGKDVSKLMTDMGFQEGGDDEKAH